MKIVADENIAKVEAFFAPHGELLTLPGRAITPQSIQHADVLLVRSVTKVDEALLADSSVTFIASATSGIDHIDTDLLAKRNITFSSAPGCNANSVVEYVFSALALLSQQGKINWRECSYGIIGAGNIGGLLAKRLSALGLTCHIYDPFLAQKNNKPRVFSSFAETLRQDVISLHIPLTREGEFPTHHLLNRDVIDTIKPGQLLINTARGSVLDSSALLQRLLRPGAFQCVLDAWENEPSINLELLNQVDIGTPHIAGYSTEGKLQGTEFIYQAFCECFGLTGQNCQAFYGDSTKFGLNFKNDMVNECILKAYNIQKDHAALLGAAKQSSPGNNFTQLRKHYAPRREFPYLQPYLENNEYDAKQGAAELMKQLTTLGFDTSLL